MQWCKKSKCQSPECVRTSKLTAHLQRHHCVAQSRRQHTIYVQHSGCDSRGLSQCINTKHFIQHFRYATACCIILFCHNITDSNQHPQCFSLDSVLKHSSPPPLLYFPFVFLKGKTTGSHKLIFSYVIRSWSQQYSCQNTLSSHTRGDFMLLAIWSPTGVFSLMIHFSPLELQSYLNYWWLSDTKIFPFISSASANMVTWFVFKYKRHHFTFYYEYHMFGNLSDLPYDDECRSKQFAVSLKKWPIQLHSARSFQIPLCQTSLLYPATDSPFVFQHSRTLVLLKHTVLVRYYQQSAISVLRLCSFLPPLASVIRIFNFTDQTCMRC